MTAPRLPRTSRRNAGALSGKGLAALQVAQECVAFGACQRTVAFVTGLPATFILRTVLDHHGGAKRGRPPYSDDFLARSTRRVQAGASSFAARYEILRSDAYHPAPALLSAYRHYRSLPGAAQFSFDEAFYLCCSLEGIWARSTPTVQLVNCRECGRRHLQPLGSTDTLSCAFCSPRRPETSRARRDCLIPALTRPPSPFDDRVALLRARQQLAALGATAPVIDAVLSEFESIPVELRPERPSDAVYRGMPLPLSRWNEYLTTVRRAQYSLITGTYLELRGNGFSPFDSIVASYRHVLPKFSRDAKLTFDRCFEVVSLCDARWGARVNLLEMRSCASCARGFLVSLRDLSRPQCPYCLLIRFPGQYRSAPRSEAPATRLEAGFRLEAEP